MNITSFGPYRTVGMRCAGKNENNEIPALWERFLARIEELDPAEEAGSFGFCRCIPGATDGSFEYVAATAVTSHSPIPNGMIEVEVPGCEYAVSRVANVADARAAWERAATAVNSSDRTPYCGVEGCECASHPSFEFYPPDYTDDSPFWVYIPVHR
jgi:predicted transcriptional regulator YdeE